MLHRDALEGAVVATDGEITIALDAEVTPELLAEGLSREFTSVLQSARKAAGFEVVDRIGVVWQAESSELAAAINQHSEEIAMEVLALSFEEGEPGDEPERVEIGESALRFSLRATKP